MKNQWVHFFTGVVKVNITGAGIERLINHFIRQKILIWNVKKHGEQSITCFFRLQDVPKVRVLFRKSGCKLAFLERRGFPFWMKKSIRNSGFFLGVLTCIFIITILSNMVWGIEIKGAKPETEHKIMLELKKMGVTTGSLQFMMKDVDTIQKELTDRIDEITWVGVVLNGTTYHFEVVEKNQPTPPKIIGPRNLVAKKEAVVTHIFVEEGQSLVKLNDHVKKGQVLVSGTIGSENNQKIVPAKGEILGETWYTSEVAVPMQSTFHVLTGEYQKKYFLNISTLHVPVFGFKKIAFKEYETEKNINNIYFLKWKLPISVQIDTYRKKEPTVRNYSIEEAITVAKEVARKELMNKLPQDAVIKGEKVLHQAKENGKVKLSIHYKVIENITLAQPIIQGD